MENKTVPNHQLSLLDYNRINIIINELEKFRINNDGKSQSKNYEHFHNIMKMLSFEDEKIKDIDLFIEKYPHFYDAPASVKYHGAFDGGLFKHSMGVYEAALKLTHVYNDIPVNFIACVFHDACKFDQYEVVPDSKNPGKTKYDYKKNYVGIQHGPESLRRLLNNGLGKYINDEWQLAIAYHMGVFNKSNEETNEFSKRSEENPEILLLHNADLIASKIYKI